MDFILTKGSTGNVNGSILIEFRKVGGFIAMLHRKFNEFSIQNSYMFSRFSNCTKPGIAICANKIMMQIRKIEL